MPSVPASPLFCYCVATVLLEAFLFPWKDAFIITFVMLFAGRHPYGFEFLIGVNFYAFSFD